MAFLGLSFGSKKQSGQQNTVTDQTTNLTGSQNQTSQQSGTTDTSSTASQTQSQSGRTSGQTTQNQSQSQTGTTSSTGTTTTLGQDVIDALTSSVGNVLGSGINESNITALSNMLAGRASGFDADSFVEGTVGQARNRGEQTLQEQTSAFSSSVGGTPETNTMAALLAQRGRNDLESNIAGIRSQAEATAQQIQNQNLSTAIQGQSGIAGIATALVEALKGGETTTDTTQLTDQIAQLIGRGTSLEGTSQTGTSTSSEQSTTNQLLNQITQLLTQQTERTQGTEDVTQKGKNGGFGFSLGI